MGVPKIIKIRVALLGAPIILTIVFWGLYGGLPPFMETTTFGCGLESASSLEKLCRNLYLCPLAPANAPCARANKNSVYPEGDAELSLEAFGVSFSMLIKMFRFHAGVMQDNILATMLVLELSGPKHSLEGKGFGFILQCFFKSRLTFKIPPVAELWNPYVIATKPGFGFPPILVGS